MQRRHALYYLTDLHRLEKELILECIADYSGSFSYDELRSVLKHIYPDLYSKLLPYGGSIATMLQSYMFITCGQLSVEGEYFEFFLQPWVVEYLNKNIEKYR